MGALLAESAPTACSKERSATSNNVLDSFFFLPRSLESCKGWLGGPTSALVPLNTITGKVHPSALLPPLSHRNFSVLG